MNKKGQHAEAMALQWLLKNQLTLLSRNYSCRFGEIDLIMLDRSILVFIEVRARSNLRFGGAAASVTKQKQQKIITTANHFLLCNSKYKLFTCRFDVMAFETSSALGGPVWYKDAFRL
ncbi:MAG: YraN family protein [Pseudomonadales bacterium]|nr:YraN family protein [Pseudomonadales bacterium]NRA16415.1 YraN family protein [Oceanospirillaceae bacterium]